jgi:hypothetical protein
MMLEVVRVVPRRGLFILLFWVEVQRKTCVGAIGTKKSVFCRTVIAEHFLVYSGASVHELNLFLEAVCEPKCS